MARSMAGKATLRNLAAPTSGTFEYNQTKIGKFDSSLGTEKEQWDKVMGSNWDSWNEEEYRANKKRHNAYMRNKFGD